MRPQRRDINDASVRTLIMEIDGARIIYSAALYGRDPMEMTLQEWREFPALSAQAATADLFKRLGVKP